MRHVVRAKLSMNPDKQGFIEVENAQEIKGVSPIVKFTMQSDPIWQVGVNGCQVIDLMEFCLNLLDSLDKTFPSEENFNSKINLRSAIIWQRKREENRVKRNIEGQTKISP